MTRTFYQLYEQELSHLRERSSEFAAAYPKVASRLFLDKSGGGRCRDPFVERLLEGFAFLTARTQLKLEAEFPRFTQGLLETVYPDYLAPGPSCSIVHFELKKQEKGLLDGITVPRQSTMESLRLKGSPTTCKFNTAHEVKLFGWEVASAEYLTTAAGGLNLGTRFPAIKGVRAALRLRLKVCTAEPAPVNQVKCDHLNLFIHGANADNLPSSLLEHLLADGLGVIVQEPGDNLHRKSTFLPASAVSQGGFSPEEALLPLSPFGFEGHRILKEHFLLRQRGLFLDVRGIRVGLEKMAGAEVNFIIPLRDRRTELEEFVQAPVFRLHCTPAVNLFRRRSNRVEVLPSHSEHQIIIDRQRMMDYEIYGILGVRGFRRTGSEEIEFRPFYLQPSATSHEPAFYTVNRHRRSLTQNERRTGTSYAGTEIFVSLVDASSAPYPRDLEQIEADCIVSNRHLPLDIVTGTGQTDFDLTGSFPVTAVRCLNGPTMPLPSHAEGPYAWRAISHLSLNYLSLVDQGPDGAEALRQLLRLYAFTKQHDYIDGLVNVVSKPSVARSPGGGPVCFIRGTDIDAVVDEDRFAGVGSFLMISALEQFLARQATMNCYTRLCLRRTPDRREICTWPIRMGSISRA
jgi:type VI secretion system protein ImpG